MTDLGINWSYKQKKFGDWELDYWVTVYRVTDYRVTNYRVTDYRSPRTILRPIALALSPLSSAAFLLTKWCRFNRPHIARVLKRPQKADQRPRGRFLYICL